MQTKTWLLTLWLSFSFWMAGAQPLSPDDVVGAWTKLDSARAATLRDADLSVSQRVGRLLDLGLWENAASILGAMPEADPALWACRARLAWLRHEYKAAEAWTQRLLAQHPASREGLLLRARLYLEAWQLSEAQQVLQPLLEAEDPAARCLQGQLWLLRKQYEKARSVAQAVQAAHPEVSEAYRLEAEAHFWLRDLPAAEAALQQCLRLDPFCAEARFSYGYAIWRRVDATQLPAMADQWELALALNPLHYPTHWHWGNGHTQLTFADYVDPDEGEIRQELREFDSLIKANALEPALALSQEIEERHFASVLPLMAEGSAYYIAYQLPREARLDSAQEVFLEILTRKPHYGPAHNGLAAVIKQRKFAYLAAFDSLEAVIEQAEITDQATLYQVFPDARRYPGDRVEKMIWSQLYTCRAYFPMLVRLGRTFVIPPLHVDLAMAMDNPYFRQATTFDNRQWMDIRGVGSGAAGIEYVERGAHLERNVLLHEYVHLFHGQIFTHTEMRRVRALYYQAMAEDRILDYYAANNEFEYLAQAIPAYFMPVKVHPLNHKSVTTRRDLETKDPGLFAFIDSLVSRHRRFMQGDSLAMASNWAQVYVSLAEQALEARSFSLAGSLLDTAATWDSRYLPEKLARVDLAMGQRQFSQADSLLQAATELAPGNGRVPLAEARLAWARLEAGKWTAGKAAERIRRAVERAEAIEQDWEVEGQINEFARRAYQQLGLWQEAIAVAEHYASQAATVSTYLRDRRDEAAAFAAALKGRLGYGEEALPFFEALIARKPQQYAFRQQYAQVLLAIGQPERAFDMLAEVELLLEAAGTPNPEFLRDMAAAQLALGDTTAALDLLSPVLEEILPMHGDVYAWVQLWLEVGNVRLTKELLMGERPPVYPEAKADHYFSRGRLALAEGDTLAAMETFELALRANPYHLPARFALLASLRAQGQAGKARLVAREGQLLPIPPGPAFEARLAAYE